MRLHVLAVLLLIAGCNKSSDSGFGPAASPTSTSPVAIAGDDLKVASGYSTGFESAGGWTLDSAVGGVGWAMDATPSTMPGGAVRSGLASLNYNNGTTFDNSSPNTGRATSPPINVAGVFGATLVFWCNYQTDTTGVATDIRRLQVSNDSFASTLVDDQLTTSGAPPPAGACSAMGVWHLHTRTLDPAWGLLQVRFVFDSVDSANNAFGGWFIDDLSILSDYSWGLESAGAWTLDPPATGVGWAIDATPASVAGGTAVHGGANSLNYNNGTDYANGIANNGAATSPPLNLAGLTGAQLRFWCNYQTDTTGTATDRRWVRISNNGFASNLLSQQLAGTAAAPYQCAAMGTWHAHILPLDPAWGSTVQVRFFFDSVDAAANGTAGWFIDDLSVAILLSGKKSYDPSGAPLTYLWEQTGGTPVAIDSPAAAETTFSYPSLTGTSTFRLTVTGPQGSTTDSVDVAFKPVVVSAPDTWFTGYEKSGTVTAAAFGRNPAFTYQWSGLEAWLPVTGASTGALGYTTPKLNDFQNFPDIAGVAVLERTTQGRLQLKVTATDAAGNTDEDFVNFSAGPFADSVANENVAFGEPVFLNGAATPSAWTWTGTKPSGSAISFFKPDKTALAAATDQRFVYFVPDQVGPYEVILIQNPGAVVKVINLTCGQYVGVGNLIGKTPDPFKGECAACHGGQLGFLADFATTWKATGHASMFERILDPSNPYHSPSQAKGHWNDAFNFGSDFSIDSRTLGWSKITAGAHNGWVEQATAEGYVFKGTSWSEMVRKFPLTAAKSNVQCESCHGPGSEHAGDTTGIRKSFDANVCGRCHSDKADLWEASSHGKPPIGLSSPSGNTSCNGCHTAQGYVVELRAQEGADPYKALLAVSNINRPVIPFEDRRGTTCQACHEPHKRTANRNTPAGQPDPQLRAYGDVEFANGVVAPAGAAANCYLCHQSRTDTRDNSTYMNLRRGPHDSTAAEMLSATNAIQFSGWPGYLSSPHALPTRFVSPAFGQNRQCLACHVDVQPAAGTPGHGAVGGHTFAVQQGTGLTAATEATHATGTAVGGSNKFTVASGSSFLRSVFAGDTLTLPAPNFGTYKVQSVDGARQISLVGASFTGDTPGAWTLTSVKKYNTAACTECHTVGDPLLGNPFRLSARADYDGDGIREAIQDEIAGLLLALKTAIEVKLSDPFSPTYTGVAATFEPGSRIRYRKTLANVTRTFPGPSVPSSENPDISWSALDDTKKAAWLALYQAGYNYAFVVNDHSEGIHNTGYAVNLLQSSYRVVTGVPIGSPFVPFP